MPLTLPAQEADFSVPICLSINAIKFYSLVQCFSSLILDSRCAFFHSRLFTSLCIMLIYCCCFFFFYLCCVEANARTCLHARHSLIVNVKLTLGDSPHWPAVALALVTVDPYWSDGEIKLKLQVTHLLMENALRLSA